MSQAYAIITSIAAVITALTVIFGAIKNSGKKIRAYEDQKKVLDKISENMEFLDELPQTIKDLSDKIDAIKEDLDIHIKENKGQTQLLLEVARNLLINEMSTAIEKGWDTVENQARIADLFDKYEKSKGNHGVKSIYEKYEKLPNEPVVLDAGKENK